MARQKRFNQRKLYGPGGKSSDLSALLTTDERAAYIRTVLWPEAEMAGRPGILCSELQRAGTKTRTFTKSWADPEAAVPLSGCVTPSENCDY